MFQWWKKVNFKLISFLLGQFCVPVLWDQFCGSVLLVNSDFGLFWFGLFFVIDNLVILNLHIKANCEIFKDILVHECPHSRFWLLVNWFLYWSWLDRYNDRWSNNWLSWWFVSWKMSLRDLMSFESEHIPYNTSCHPFNIVICHFFCFTINILW